MFEGESGKRVCSSVTAITDGSLPCSAATIPIIIAIEAVKFFMVPAHGPLDTVNQPGTQEIAMAYVVRYGRMRFLGEYTGTHEHEHVRGQRVVIRSERGTELGEILCPATARTASYLDQPAHGDILRPANPEDLEQEANLIPAQHKAFQVCLELISKHRLQMDLVDVEIILGRERMVFYYLAEKRVDFRDLVKDLARVFRTRIEMRQIGVRDEAKLLADYGDCGKPVCCNTHLTAMPPVSMKMAKLQKTTLDPAKISGRCGRLKCCLRYEFDTYREYERKLPSVGSQVVTSKGRGRVDRAGDPGPEAGRRVRGPASNHHWP